MGDILTVAKVILVNTENRVLLLRRSESDARRPLEWDIPGGHVDEDEFAEEAAARETREEAGIPVDSHQLKLAYTITEMVKPDLNVSWLFYIAHTDKSEIKLSSEHCEYVWKSLDEALEMIDYHRQKAALSYIHDHQLL